MLVVGVGTARANGALLPWGSVELQTNLHMGGEGQDPDHMSAFDAHFGALPAHVLVANVERYT